jgi:hypothetical protein
MRRCSTVPGGCEVHLEPLDATLTRDKRRPLSPQSTFDIHEALKVRLPRHLMVIDCSTWHEHPNQGRFAMATQKIPTM